MELPSDKPVHDSTLPLTSARLFEIFNSLPPAAQNELAENHVFPLLDSVPRDQYDTLASAIIEHQSRIRSMPKLAQKIKRREISGLLDALSRDAKVAFTKERSNREELLTELVDSLTSWLSDIWTVVHDYKDDYLAAHSCLMFTSEGVKSLQEMDGVGGCPCFIRNMPIDITIKRKNGQIMKTFALRGPHEIRKALLWVWRELLLSLSAYGNPTARKKIPEIIEDIESIMGWEALERLVYGGNACVVRNPRSIEKTLGIDENDDDDDDRDCDCDGDGEYEDEDRYYANSDDDGSYDDDGEDYFDEDEDEDDGEDGFGIDLCHCASPMRHWSRLIKQQRSTLRELILNRLHTNFRLMPSMKLYQVIRSVTLDFDGTSETLLRELGENATKSSDTFVNALVIYCSLQNASQIDRLLRSHYHLLRPRDAEVLQLSVALLIDSPFPFHAMQILEQEFLESVRSVHSAIVSTFGHINLEEQKRDIESILKLRKGTQERRDRIERWLDNVTTNASTLDPLAFTMMMGFGFGSPEEGNQGDIATILENVDLSDPDWADVVEQYKPHLKARLMGWNMLLSTSRKNSRLSSKMYVKTMETMPFLRGMDIVEAMVTRLHDMHGKGYIADGLGVLSNFCASHVKKIQRPARPRPVATTS